MAIDSSAYKIHVATSGDYASVREGREAFHAFRMAVGDSLGPIGELIHLMDNPWLRAIGGVVLALKMLTDNENAAEENTRKLTEASDKQRLLFANAALDALRAHTSELAKWADQQKHARDSLDLVSEAMKRQIDLQKELTSATNSGTDAALTTYEARIKLLELEGKMTGPAADAGLRAAKEHAQQQKDAADDAEKQGEIQAHKTRSAQAVGEVVSAQAGLDALGDKQTDAAHNLNAATALVPDLEKAAVAAAAALTAATTGHNTMVLYPDLEEAPEVSDEKFQQAKDADRTAKDALLAQKDLVSKYTDAKKAADKDIDAANTLILAKEELARTELQMANEEQKSFEIAVQARRVREQAARDTDTINRRIALESNAHRTPDEEAELRGMTEPLFNTRNRGTGQITRGMADNANRALRILRDRRNTTIGPMDAEYHQRVHEILQEIIGAQQNTQAAVGSMGAQLNDLQRQAADLNARADSYTGRP